MPNKEIEARTHFEAVIFIAAFGHALNELLIFQKFEIFSQFITLAGVGMNLCDFSKSESLANDTADFQS